jgi:signal-transduction protein with cAMP-binding, CBS, and nucleotidyltransferase domain
MSKQAYGAQFSIDVSTLSLNCNLAQDLITMAHMEIDEMKVQNYMTSNPITVQQGISISDAINIMATKGIGNLIVLEGSSGPVGLLTERELVDYLSLNGRFPKSSSKGCTCIRII